MGKSSFASLFEYHLEMSGQLQESITKINNVRPEERYTIHRQNSLEIDLKQLQRFLGDYQNIKFSLEIKIKHMKCLDCKKDIASFPMYLGVQGTYCEKCKSGNCTVLEEKKLHACKFKECSYFGTAECLPKHELWFCTSSINPCYLCHKQFRNTTMIEHWKQSHVQSIHCSDKMFHDKLKMKMQYISELDVFDAVFFCWWHCELSTIEFKVTSNLPIEKLMRFNSEIKILDEVLLTLIENGLHKNYYWTVTYDTNKKLTLLDRYTLKFSIEESNKQQKIKRNTKGMFQFYFK